MCLEDVSYAHVVASKIYLCCQYILLLLFVLTISSSRMFGSGVVV